MSRILLLLDSPRNRELIAEWLAEAFEPIVTETAAALDDPFDVGVVDCLALDRHRAAIQERRRREEPVFLPFLLVTSRPDVRLVTRHLWRTVDELILSPVEKVELRARVEILLRSRRLSVELREQIQRAEYERHRAEVALESKARLIRGLSHDLKNPLGAIQGHAQLLATGVAGAMDADQREWVRRIDRAAARTLHMIDDLLELARAESGGLSVNRQPTDLGRVARDAAEEYGPAAKEKRLHTELVVPAVLPRVRTDPHRVRQVLGNLLSNAIKYTPAGGRVAIRVEVGETSPDEPPRREDAHPRGPIAAITITDTGPGIPRTVQDHIFEEFTRVGETEEPGTGLGLAISRTIARLLGGDVTVRSEPGQGSTFTLWLPLDVEEPKHGEAEHASDGESARESDGEDPASG